MVDIESKKILIAVPHADDEVAFAGILLKARAEWGMGLKEALFTDSSQGGDFRNEGDQNPIDIVVMRDRERQIAAGLLEIEMVERFHQTDTQLQATPELAFRFARLVQRIKPEVVITTWKKDTHPDHTAAYKIVKKGLTWAAMKLEGKGLKEPFRVPLLLASEMTKPAGDANYFEDVTQYGDKIAQVYDAYESQLSPKLRAGLNGIRMARGFGLSYPENTVALGEGFVIPDDFPALHFPQRGIAPVTNGRLVHLEALTTTTAT